MVGERGVVVGMSVAALIVLGALFALRAVMTFRPSSWLWGLDTLADAPPLMKGAGLLLALLGVVLAWRARSAPHPRRSRAWILWAAVLLAFGMLAAMPCRHLLLGDGQTYVSAMDRGVHVSGTAHREPLPVAVVDAVHRALGGPALRAFAVTGLLLGLLTLVLAALIARELSEDSGTQLAIFAVIALGGGLQLFARYAEYYAFALAAALLLLWAALRWIQGRGSFLLVALTYVVAGLCHAIFLFAAPAMIYLAWLAWKRGERRSVLHACVLAPLLGVAALLLLHYPFSEIAKEASRGSMFLPPIGARTERTPYTAFAPAHWIELFDLVALIAPGLLVALVLLPSRRARWTETQRFAALLAPGTLFFVLFAQAELGTPRDWDLYVVPITLLAFAAITRAAQGEERGRIGALGPALLVTGLVTAGAWLSSNHAPTEARGRLARTGENAALYGPKSRGELWRYLSSSFAASGDPTLAIRSAVRAIESEPDDRQNYRMLASLRIEQRGNSASSVESAVQQTFQDLNGIHYREGYLYHGLAFSTALAGRLDLALWAAEKGAQAEPKNAEIAATLGDMLRRLGRDADAGRAYDAALALDPNLPRARVGAATLRGIAGDQAALRAGVVDALRRAPWSPQAQQFQRLVESGQTNPEALRAYVYVR